VTVGNETIQTTMLRPFWVISGKDLDERPIRSHLELPPRDSKVEGRWVDATDLRVNDRLLLQSQTEATVEKIAHVHTKTVVYNFSVDELRCYAVGNQRVLVHNTNGSEAAAGAQQSLLNNSNGVQQNLVSNAATNTQITLKGAAWRANSTVGTGSGPVHGTKVHSAFESEVNSLGNKNLSTEVSYLNGRVDPRGTPGSVRLDVVEGPVNGPTGIYDLKTGNAILTRPRIDKIQENIPGGAIVPVIEIR
jgi:hypothetical protein